jgi:hypothetical protein
MNRPDKIIKYLHVKKDRDDIWVDFNGKPSYSYSIEIPYWLGRAYKFNCGTRLKVEICGDGKSFKQQQEEETKEYDQYFNKNWSKKMTKMRKLNHGYLLIAHGGKGTGWFKSIEDYNNYHIELDALNKKYGVKRPEI